MKLTILGTSAAYAGRNDACSSYLITLGEGHYLLDVGSGAVSFLQNHIEPESLGGIFLSHLHADHVSDLFTLRYALFVSLRDGLMEAPIPLYLPRTPEGAYAQIEGEVDGELTLRALDERTTVDVDGARIDVMRTRHPIETYAMRIREREKTLVYTSDTGYFPGLVDFSSGADLLLCEATLQNADGHLEEMGHMTAERAGRLAAEAGTKELVLTHIWPRYDRAVSLEEARGSYGGRLSVARRGDVFVP